MNAGGIRRQLEDSARLHERIKELEPAIKQAADACVSALRSGNKIIFFGNGGSASDAQHLACELVVKYGFERPAIPAIALNTNASVLTASANDLGFDTIFSRQIEALGAEGDVVFAISTSGRSPNVLEGAGAARKRGCFLVAMTGEGGTGLAARADLAIVVPHSEAARIQEAHITIGHVICDLVESALYGESGV